MLEPAFAIPGAGEKMAADHPIGRVTEAEEVARVVLFLASEEASFIVGHALTIDGGLVIQ